MAYINMKSLKNTAIKLLLIAVFVLSAAIPIKCLKTSNFKTWKFLSMSDFLSVSSVVYNYILTLLLMFEF